MKSIQYGDGGLSRRVIAAMATDDVVVGRIASHWPSEGLFGQDAAGNLIGRWCVSFHRKYGSAPGPALRQKFESWSQDADKDLVKMVGSYLEAASAEAGIASDAVLDMASELFNSIALREAMDQASVEQQRGSHAKAEEIIASRRRISFALDAWIDPGFDTEAWTKAWDQQQERPLVTYPGILGDFFSDAFGRDQFTAFIASTAKGKSWWLLDAAYRALRQRRKVAYFECGDLSESQVLFRMAQRSLRRPLKDSTVAWPVDIRQDEPVMESRTLAACDPYDALREWKRLQRDQQGVFRVYCVPNDSITVVDIEAKVLQWVQDGWSPDILVIDYADILAPPPGYYRETRDQINATWKVMRRMSQKWHCLVLTATQADAKSYDTFLLRRKNFSDDRRKLDHVTSMFGINMTDDEAKVGLSRINSLKRRSEGYAETRQIRVAGCLSCGCPAVISDYFVSDGDTVSEEMD